jgi:hypothetical protein
MTQRFIAMPAIRVGNVKANPFRAFHIQEELTIRFGVVDIQPFMPVNG